MVKIEEILTTLGYSPSMANSCKIIKIIHISYQCNEKSNPIMLEGKILVFQYV